MPSLRDIQSSAESGDIGSQCELAMLYAIGKEVHEDNREAAYWWSLAAEQGHAPSQFNLGNLYYRGKGVELDYARAAHWYRKAAEHAHEGFMGRMWEYCTVEESKTGIEAAIYSAFVNLGRCYANGHGVAKDDVEAYAYYNLGGIRSGPIGDIGRKNIAMLESKMTRAEISSSQTRTRELKAYYCKISF